MFFFLRVCTLNISDDPFLGSGNELEFKDKPTLNCKVKVNINSTSTRSRKRIKCPPLKMFKDLAKV